MIDAPDEYEFEIVRKPFRPPPTINCVLCQQLRPLPWNAPQPEGAAAIICDSCARHWSQFGLGQTYRATRGDRRQYQRLSALTNALIWEIKNGKRRRFRTAF